MKIRIAMNGFIFPISPTITLLIGLALFGVVFALNSAVHSYLIVAMVTQNGVSKAAGFYYMASAGN